jgi:hypothetical protein
MVDFSTSVPPPSLQVTSLSSALGAAGLAARLAKHEDATRSSRHVCHAPTLSAAKKDDLEVESQQRLYRRQMDRKLALLRFVFTPRDTA